MRALTGAACAVAVAWASLIASAPAASEDVLLTTDVMSMTALDNGCTTSAARGLGSVLPGANALTTTGAGVCRIGFVASVPTQLRIGQSDGTGTAMGLGTTAPVLLDRDNAPGRTLGVFGVSSTLAFGIGKQSTLYRTLDGTTWGVPPGNGNNMWDIEATPGDTTTWWATGENRRLYRLTNALAIPDTNVVWTNVSSSLAGAGWTASADVNELTIPDPSTIWIAGEDRWIGRYAIGTGTTTAFQHTDTGVDSVVAIDSLSATNVMAASASGRVLRTTTGATTSAGWTVTTLPGGPTLTDLAIASATRAYAVGLDGYLAVWDGSTWTDRSADLALPRDVMGVDSVPGSPDTVLALDGAGTVHRSTDAGATWTHHPTGSASRTGDIHAATATDAYVVSAERSLSASHDGGMTWTTQGPVASEELSGIAASPVNGRRLLAVGASARRSTNAGSSWASASTGSPYALRAAALANDTSGWAVGDGGTIRHTDDLGATWSAQSPPPGVTQSLLDVTALSELAAIAVGFDGTILTTGNGGASWLARAGTSRTLTGVDATGSLALAVGARGTILRSTDAGTSWSAVPGGSMPNAAADLLDVAFADPSTAYAITRTQVWRSTDAGQTWTLAQTLAGDRLRALDASGRTVVVSGFDDRVEYSTDGGATFTGATGSTTMHLGAVALVDPHTAVIAGADAVRMRMDVDPAPDVQVPDWASGTNDWDSGGFFGVCLQAIGGGAVADWTVDAANVAGRCEALDSDPWRAVPATASVAAHVAAATSGTVDLVWGMRAAPGQRNGTYEAGVSFEVVSP